jgi:hypothetical protein
MAIKDISLSPITDPAELKSLAALEHFHNIPDEMLLKLAQRVTVFRIPDRMVAIRLIRANGIPIPVMKPPASSGKK